MHTLCTHILPFRDFATTRPLKTERAGREAVKPRRGKPSGAPVVRALRLRPALSRRSLCRPLRELCGPSPLPVCALSLLAYSPEGARQSLKWRRTRRARPMSEPAQVRRHPGGSSGMFTGAAPRRTKKRACCCTSGSSTTKLRRERYRRAPPFPCSCACRQQHADVLARACCAAGAGWCLRHVFSSRLSRRLEAP